MRYGAVNGVKGLYTYPSGSGAQFTNGADAISALGLDVLKIYLTADYLTDYPLESAWSSTPTNLTQLVQTTEVATQLASNDWSTVIATVFTFANGTTNWWRVDVAKTKLDNEYTEIKNLATHLLTTYNNSGKTFVLQNWEGDWAFGDTFTANSYIWREYVDRYAAFLGVRQKAVEDARRETAHRNVTVLHAVEMNRVLDARAYPHRRRILTDISRVLQPDMVSWSAYDGTIVDQGGWNANQAAWEAATEPTIRRAISLMKAYFPGVPWYVGEFGFPELEAQFERPSHNVANMIGLFHDICEAEGCKYFIYWQAFDNEANPSYTYRGYWLKRNDGTKSIAGAKMEELAAG